LQDISSRLPLRAKKQLRVRGSSGRTPSPVPGASGLALGRGRANETAAELAPGVARPRSCSVRSVGGAPIASQIRCAPAAIGAERADSPKASYIWDRCTTGSRTSQTRPCGPRLPVPPGFSERCGKDLVLQRYHLAAEPRIVSPPPDASPPRGPLSDAALASLS